MNKQELVAKLYRVASQFTDIPVYELSQMTGKSIEKIIPIINELLDYRTGLIQSQGIDDSLITDMITLCQMIINQEKPVSQLRLAHSLLERMEK